jgi:hypothetical protein
MKIKNDFVTNSSSTCFLFAFKGKTRKDLYKKILDHEMTFFLTMDYDGFCSGVDEEEDNGISCKADDVIDALKSKRKQFKVVTIDEKIKEIKKSCITWTKYGPRYSCFVYECKSKLAILNHAKKLGINNVMEVCFGDNDGPFSGTKVGLIMDYEGRYISIYDDDFVVMTEQRR